MRQPLVILSLVVVLPLGCATSPHRPQVRPSGIDPLREAEFDGFANELADAIDELLAEHDYRLPAIIALPRVEPGGVEDGSIARAFAHRLAEGLNDRLRGAALFRTSGVTPPTLRCTLRFTADAENPRGRVIAFQLFDEKSGQELLSETCRYLLPRRAPMVQAARPPTDDLEIDAASDEIGELALRHAAAYRERTIAGSFGRVIFLDSKSWKRLWLQSHRAARTDDDRLRLELEVRARRRERNAELRVIFYDDLDNVVDVTPVIPYCFLPHYTKQVTITSADPRAARYICLFEYD